MTHAGRSGSAATRRSTPCCLAAPSFHLLPPLPLQAALGYLVKVGEKCPNVVTVADRFAPVVVEAALRTARAAAAEAPELLAAEAELLKVGGPRCSFMPAAACACCSLLPPAPAPACMQPWDTASWQLFSKWSAAWFVRLSAHTHTTACPLPPASPASSAPAEHPQRNAGAAAGGAGGRAACRRRRPDGRRCVCSL